MHRAEKVFKSELSNLAVFMFLNHGFLLIIEITKKVIIITTVYECLQLISHKKHLHLVLIKKIRGSSYVLGISLIFSRIIFLSYHFFWQNWFFLKLYIVLSLWPEYYHCSFCGGIEGAVSMKSCFVLSSPFLPLYKVSNVMECKGLVYNLIDLN